MSTIAPQAALPDTLTLGPVRLTVSDLDRAVEFYRDALGLRVLRYEHPQASLGTAEEDVLVLVEQPGAHAAGRHAGLYHVALLYPSRRQFAHAAQRLLVRRTPIQGASDHRTHEALYLADPDGNGLELAADRPRDMWPAPDGPGGYGGGRPLPLDITSVLALTADEPPPQYVGEGLRVGHVHLHVGDIERATGFYCDVLGFELQANLGSAAFVSAGGYHHHLAFNTWQGPGVGPPPPGTVGLVDWTVQLQGAEDLESVRKRLEHAGIPWLQTDRGMLVRDPWDIAVRIERA
jgi:catechol 2,3-dioxygenase